MKVLHIFNSHRHGGGSDNAWADTIRLSRANGMEIEVFSRTSKSLSPTLRDKASAALSGIYAPGAVHAAAEAVTRYNPDLVHTHELYPLISPFVLKRVARMGIPIVHTCYDYRLTCPVATHYQHGAICHRCMGGREYWAVLNDCRDNRAESIAYAIRNAVARRFDLFRRYVSEFIVLTEFSRQWLIRELGIEPGRVTVNHCAIEIPATPADPGQGQYIAYAGRFVVEKGVELLVEAARRTGLPVRLAGNAETHPAIRPGDPVECVLTPTREDLTRFYREARLLVVPSLWYETFGIVAAEAMPRATMIDEMMSLGRPAGCVLRILKFRRRFFRPYRFDTSSGKVAFRDISILFFFIPAGEPLSRIFQRICRERPSRPFQKSGRSYRCPDKFRARSRVAFRPGRR